MHNEHPPGTTWRTCRAPGTRPYRSGAVSVLHGIADHARVTYHPVNPWDLTKRLERPYHVFINGSAQMSYVSLEAARSHLIARGFNPLGDPVPFYPSETDVSATAF